MQAADQEGDRSLLLAGLCRLFADASCIDKRIKEKSLLYLSYTAKSRGAWPHNASVEFVVNRLGGLFAATQRVLAAWCDESPARYR